ncbi:sensor domain-containing diguanylate cyclase [Zoogloea sp.]|uniref:sensor domain-containing diguanylate cyclase n=1 Tax=Zoogloea sp. TaxID=49181 RepID=UPI001416D3E4|nr:MAG: diguanylate cyclase [Zoogloea sp.]
MYDTPTQIPLAERILRLHDASPLLIGVFDEHDMLRYANPAFRRALGLPPDTFMTWQDLMRLNHRQRVGTRIETTDFEAWLASARSRRGKLPYRAFEAERTDGRWNFMTESLSPDGWMLCVAVDITDLRADERSLRADRDGAWRAARTDALTGVSNRMHILHLLDEQLAQLRSSGQPCGIALIDLDHFKSVNDRYGHYGGDLVLRDFAHVVASTLRRVDGFGRLGGEEFLAVLPGVDRSELAGVLQRLHEAVRRSRPLSEHPGFHYSFSAGAGMLEGAEDALTNIRRADHALYEAKAAGRDCHVMLP